MEIYFCTKSSKVQCSKVQCSKTGINTIEIEKMNPEVGAKVKIIGL